MTSRAEHWYRILCSNVGNESKNLSESQLMARFGVTRGFARYWTAKAADPNFHSGELGGAHNMKFTMEAQEIVERLLWDELQRDPLRTPTALARDMSQILGVEIDVT